MSRIGPENKRSSLKSQKEERMNFTIWATSSTDSVAALIATDQNGKGWIVQIPCKGEAPHLHLTVLHASVLIALAL